MTKPKSTTTVKKMATLAGSLAAVGTMQADSRAAIQHFNTSPVTASFSDEDGYEAGWDVDDDGTLDAQMVVESTTGASSSEGEILMTSVNTGVEIATDGGTDRDFVRFAESESVGPSANFRNLDAGLLSFNSSFAGYGLNSAVEDHLQSGDNYIGFRFDKDDGSGDIFYGWANLNLNLTNGTASITEWAWEDTANTAIDVADTGAGGGGVVPEPSSLALLAMGAGGLFAYRARQKKLSADRSTEVTV